MVYASTQPDPPRGCSTEWMQRGRWATARIVFLTMVVAGTATGGLAAYLLGPLYAWCFFGDLRFFRYHRITFPLVAAFWKLIGEWLRDPAYRRMFAIPLTAPPMMVPDLSRVRVRAGWREGNGGCNGCIQCCIRRDCPMLDTERNRCLSYGSLFWRYFNCGRYPESADQIRYYDCPKWEVRNG